MIKMSRVILGMPGPWADSNYEAADHYTTKIGGLPDWPFPRSILSPDLLKCGLCGSNLCLVAQVYAPVSSPSLTIEDRILYIFYCPMPQCESTPLSWQVLRVQKLSSSEESAVPCKEGVLSPPSSRADSNKHWQDDLWSFNSKEDDDDTDLEELGRAFSELASITSDSKKQNGSAKSSKKAPSASQPATNIDDKVPVLSCFYLYTVEEKLQKKVTSGGSISPSLAIKENGNDLDDHSEGETWEEESYEYDRALSADRTYLKFKKRIDAYPEQCLRYSYGGKPLLASGEVEDPGMCRHCGAPLLYEMQMMPPLIYFLQEASDEKQKISIEKINWMTLIVYTCSKSCHNQSNQLKSSCENWVVVEETVVIQYE